MVSLRRRLGAARARLREPPGRRRSPWREGPPEARRHAAAAAGGSEVAIKMEEACCRVSRRASQRVSPNHVRHARRRQTPSRRGRARRLLAARSVKKSARLRTRGAQNLTTAAPLHGSVRRFGRAGVSRREERRARAAEPPRRRRARADFALNPGFSKGLILPFGDPPDNESVAATEGVFRRLSPLTNPFPFMAAVRGRSFGPSGKAATCGHLVGDAARRTRHLRMRPSGGRGQDCRRVAPAQRCVCSRKALARGERDIVGAAQMRTSDRPMRPPPLVL